MMGGMNTGTPPGEETMSTADLPTVILDPDSADPSEPGPSTQLTTPPKDDPRGDVDDLPRAS